MALTGSELARLRRKALHGCGRLILDALPPDEEATAAEIELRAVLTRWLREGD